MSISQYQHYQETQAGWLRPLSLPLQPMRSYRHCFIVVTTIHIQEMMVHVCTSKWATCALWLVALSNILLQVQIL